MTRDNLHIEVALLISLLLHATGFGSYHYRGTLAHWAMFRPLVKLVEFYSPQRTLAHPLQTITFVETDNPPVPPPRRDNESPRQFMETDETQVSGEEPKGAKFYSDKSTVAANPANPTDKQGETPYLEGKETRLMSTEDVPLPTPSSVAPIPPAPPSPPPAPAASPLPKAEEKQEIADKGREVAAAPKKQETPEKQVAMLGQEAPQSQTTPSSSAGAAQSGAGSRRELVTTKSKLVASGVFRLGAAAFNVKESPFGAYDLKLFRAVQSRWYALIDRYGIYERTGSVTLNFELYEDGTVHSLQRKNNTAGEILALYCEKAIVDSAPFEPWPEQLRVLLGNQPREVQLTFYY